MKLTSWVALVALALMADASNGQKVLAPRPDNPTSDDKATLMQVAAKCQLHEGALYFVQYKAPTEPVIHMTGTMGEAQKICVLENLPNDFSMRFGMDILAPAKP
ncbi:hypothetical protein LZ016_06440 [Sphingomonas sp. SM33]|uniref:Uncharacterized protein n=1 Tax=Sphingomonas telluris TaxID=2907998 RepID=A0ABS9VMU2_9SPHN|nr:hypothetical protein [Sphingomonas telluris]MCH8615737.1 hypothetical protein [Sphingomonas telluris]